MGKKRSECNKDPDRARKSAMTDLRCAAAKLANWLGEQGYADAGHELLDQVQRTGAMVTHAEGHLRPNRQEGT